MRTPLRRASAMISSGSRLPSTWMCSSLFGSASIKAAPRPPAPLAALVVTASVSPGCGGWSIGHLVELRRPFVEDEARLVGREADERHRAFSEIGPHLPVDERVVEADR